MFSLKVDKSAWEKIKKDVMSQAKLSVKVGWFEGDRYGSDKDFLPVAQVAAWNEEGSATNPPRPAIRVGFMAPIQAGSYENMFEASINRILSGKSSFQTEYTRIGAVATKDLKQAIDDWDTPPNSPRTVAEKGFNDPLIWTGTMRDTVNFKIDRDN